MSKIDLNRSQQRETDMKSIAGSIVVLAGAVLMGLSHENIPNSALLTLSSLVLMAIGLVVVVKQGLIGGGHE